MDGLIAQLAEPELLTWSAVFSLGGFVFLFVGLLVSVVVARRPRLFWPLLIVVNLFGMGPKIGGYFIIDEVFTGFIVLGALTRLALRRTQSAPTERTSPELALFKLWIGYMIIQACIGVLMNDDIKLLRWVLLYVVIGLLALISSHRSREFPFPSGRGASLLISGTAIVYFLGYLAVGIVSELLLLDSFGPFARFVSQGAYWAGSAAAVFPAIVAIPAAMLLLEDSHRSVRAIAWTSLAVMMAVGFYFFSRTLWLVLVVFVVIASFTTVTLRRTTIVAGVFLVGALIFFPSSRDVPKFLNELVVAAKVLWSPGESDAQSRRLQFEAGVNTAFSDWKGFLLGAGIYSHRFLIVPHVRALIAARFPEQDDYAVPASRVKDDPPTLIIRTTGAAALLIDTGIVGVTLLLTTVGLMLRRVWRTRVAHRTSLVAVLVLVPLWLFASNILDAVLLYLLIMPNGIVGQFARTSRLGFNRQSRRLDQQVARQPNAYAAP